MIKSAVRSLFDDFQKSLFYWLTFVVTTLFMFVFFQIACSPMIGMKFIEGKNDLVAYLSVLVITVSVSYTHLNVPPKHIKAFPVSKRQT